MKGPWIWGARTDVAVFGGSTLVALVFAWLAPLLSEDGALPSWAWFAFVLCVDVAHVHSTLFRTYLDKAELRKRPLLYILAPLSCLVLGIALHLASERLFWRVLAYVAVFHFVRQQIGWVAIYRAKAAERDRLGRLLDDATVYAATGYPLLHWHAHLPRPFHWFVDGDFVSLPIFTKLLPLGFVVWAGLLASYVLRALWAGLTKNPGKHLVVLTTALTWYLGIVATSTDFQFTVTNVLVHGLPYMALLFVYSRERAREEPKNLVTRLATGGLLAFCAVVLSLAFVEEMVWDRLVWHDRPSMFGGVMRTDPLLGPFGRALIVPLLSLPQVTHYVLDALLWRRGDTGPAQARALGFPGRGAARA